MVAAGDIHGEYAGFVSVLRAAGLLDARERWIGGKAHLVHTGDAVDRAGDSQKALDLLTSSEKQSARAGGRVHALIGDHEAMNLYGNLRYTTAGEVSNAKCQHATLLGPGLYTQASGSATTCFARTGPEVACYPTRGPFEARL